MKLTKTEQNILGTIGFTNGRFALAAVGTNPNSANYYDRANRFIKRLADAGLIVWMPYSDKFGAGWALRDQVEVFYRNGYKMKTFNYHFVRTSDQKVFEVESDLIRTHVYYVYNDKGERPLQDRLHYCGGHNYAGDHGMYIRVTKEPTA